MKPPSEKDVHTIRVHYVGGRDGEIGEWNSHFLQDYFFYIYDADERCLPQVVQLNEERGRHVQVLPYIIDEQPSAPAKININYCPCTSSLASAAEFRANQYSASPLLGDYIYNECFRTVDHIPGTARSIDSLAEEKNFVVDFLAMDTNGTEDKVIKGAQQQLEKHGVAVNCEVEFHEIYKDQALFGDVSALLHELGFNFMRFFDKGARVNYFKGGIGWRGDGLVMSVDALFMKDLDRVEAQNANPQAALLKLAFLALSHGYVEYALDALVRASEKYDRARLPATGGPRYLDFLAKLYALYRSTPQFNQPKFSDLFTHEEALRRFDAGEQKHPWLTMDLAKARQSYFGGIDLAEFRQHFPRLLSQDDTPFEALLRQNGFETTADLVHDKRVQHARLTAESLQLIRMQDGAAVVDFGLLASEVVQKASNARAQGTTAARWLGKMLRPTSAKRPSE